MATAFVPVDVDLDGLVFADARTGRPVVLGAEPRPGVLTVIRHRY
ncbi:MAG: hypothetical protein ACR2HV_00570 [Acidimicrobiales bacterium]